METTLLPTGLFSRNLAVRSRRDCSGLRRQLGFMCFRLANKESGNRLVEPGEDRR
jgi:hypothetical protein